MKIFPNIVTRIGGAPFETLNSSDSIILQDFVEGYLLVNNDVKNSKLKLSEELHAYNQLISEKKLQNQIQNLRRAIYNQRNIKEADWKILESKIHGTLFLQITKHIDLITKLKNLLSDLQQTFQQISFDYKLKIWKIAESDFLKNGILLSSADLDDQLRFHRNSTTTPDNFYTNLDLTLFKYISRSCAKTSPFSTFNNIMLCRQSKAGSLPAITENYIHKDDASSHIRLNNMLFKYLTDLLLSVPAFNDRICVNLNPTVSRFGNHFAYLTTFNNIESFQNLQIDEISGELYQFLSTAGAVKKKDIIDLIYNKKIAARESVIKYIDDLISVGLIEYYIPISGIDPEWDLKFCDYLLDIYGTDFDSINILYQTLKIMRTCGRNFEIANYDDRKKELVLAYNSFKETCKLLLKEAEIEFQEFRPSEISKRKKSTINQEPVDQEPADQNKVEFRIKRNLLFRFQAHNIFYEDTTRHSEFEINSSELESVVNKMNFLFSATNLPDFKKLAIQKTKDFFIGTFGAGGTVPLLTFYESYSRHRKKQETEQKSLISEIPQNNNIEPGSRPTVNETLQEIFTEKFNESIKDKSEKRPCIYHLYESDLCIKPTEERKPMFSKGAFVQFYQDRNPAGEMSLIAVLNTHFQGYGKAIARFLHVLEPKVLIDLKKYNSENLGADNKLLCEICDSSYFNANIHQPIFDFEIQTPGSHNNLGVANKIKVSDISVTYSPYENKLQLIHNISKQKILTFDLGLQSLTSRSKLYQLLDQFTNSNSVSLYPLANVINSSLTSEPENNAGISFNPRIIFEDQIVIQRQLWEVKPAAIPKRKPEMLDHEYYIYINEWRKATGIPDEIFIRLKESAQKPIQKKENRKPQYINFFNPLAIKLFEKITNTECELLIEEMLPTSNHLLSLNNEKFVTEFVIQWYQN